MYFHPEWPDIKLAQAALVCSQAAAMIQEEKLHVADVPVMLGGDWNSLWRKYRPDVYDDKVSSHSCADQSCTAFSSLFMCSLCVSVCIVCDQISCS